LCAGSVKYSGGLRQGNRVNGYDINDGVDLSAVLLLTTARSTRAGCERQIAINAGESFEL
jgi:hypothetical protein